MVLPGSRRGSWGVSNISCGPTLLSLNSFVAGEKVAAFLLIPVHGATFLRFCCFLINEYQEHECRNPQSYLAFTETGLSTFLFFLGDQGFLLIWVEFILEDIRAAWWRW